MTGSFDESIEFAMREVFDDPDAVRLVVSGELDLAVAEMLADRLRQLRNAGYAVASIWPSANSSTAAACGS